MQIFLGILMMSSFSSTIVDLLWCLLTYPEEDLCPSNPGICLSCSYYKREYVNGDHCSCPIVLKPDTKMKCVLLALLPALIAASSLEDIANSPARQGKLFFVSSSSTTSTFSTATYCWTTGGTAVTTACKRKKRSILFNLGNIMKNIRVSGS